VQSKADSEAVICKFIFFQYICNLCNLLKSACPVKALLFNGVYSVFLVMSDYTPTVEDNLLGIFDKAKLNEEEAKGIIRAEQYILDLDADIKMSVSIILKERNI